MSGLPAALWLLGLLAAAPALRTSRSYGIADRLRDTLVLGIAIPFVLGFVHLLYPIACWSALALCLGAAYRRRFFRAFPEGTPDRHPPYLLIGALAAVAWPQLMRPLLEGDSLSYHLPNAASWVQAHSLWTTATRYWWYPPASELFASALYAVAGPFGLPWCGFGALALAGFRVFAWARERFGASPLLADALAAAAITAYPLAIQAGTLQNDVWLLAFWLESLWAIGVDDGAAVRAIAITVLTKPQGWILAAIALAAARAQRTLWLAAAGAIAVWAIHDALLWQFAILAPASTSYGSTFSSSILAHGAGGIALFARVAVRASPFATLAICAALLGPLIGRRERRLAWGGFAAALLFFALPFGFESNVAQLASGASLRFAAPAIVAGALLLVRPARRFPSVAVVVLCASALFGVVEILAVFYNDAPTRLAPLVALLAVGAVALARVSRSTWLMPAGIVAVALAGGLLAASHPVDFYADALRADGRATAFYAWVERNRPTAIGALGLPVGTVNVLSPRTRTLELPDANSCAVARSHGVLLAAMAENDRTAAFNRARLRAARACGPKVYDDGIVVVTAPVN